MVYGSQGSDSLQGMAGDDTIYGGQGQDTLEGNAGNDLLIGNRGDDYLSGAGGDDVLSGGSGVDTFVFADHLNEDCSCRFGNDIVTDFELGVDIALVDGFVSNTTTNVLGTTFSFNGDHSIIFANVTMDASDLEFI